MTSILLCNAAQLRSPACFTKPFKASQVYIKNVDKRIMYMVYTSGGQFRAVQLFPGNYEVSVTLKGFKSDVQKVAVKAGDAPKMKLTLQEEAVAGTAVTDVAQNLEGTANNNVRVSFDTYDNVYPAGPGRDGSGYRAPRRLAARPGGRSPGHPPLRLPVLPRPDR